MTDTLNLSSTCDSQKKLWGQKTKLGAAASRSRAQMQHPPGCPGSEAGDPRTATPNPQSRRTLQPEQRLFSLVTTRGRWRPPYPTAKLPGHPTSEETSIPALVNRFVTPTSTHCYVIPKAILNPQSVTSLIL